MTVLEYYLSLNRYSRIGIGQKNPQGIVLHQAINRGCSAITERNNIEKLKIGKKGIYYSVHYIVGPDGEVINIIPEDEVAYHRLDKIISEYISVEYCYFDETKPPSINTKTALKELVADIARRNNFDINSSFIRHRDISNNQCPYYYSKNDDAWQGLKKEIIMEQRAYEELNKDPIPKKVAQVLGINEDYSRKIMDNNIIIGSGLKKAVIDKLLGTTP